MKTGLTTKEGISTTLETSITQYNMPKDQIFLLNPKLKSGTLWACKLSRH